MKDIFPGYSRKSDSEIKKIWEKGIIIFDANVLLNLYRYSKGTRQTVLELLEKFKERICLPHQAALEYNRNRYEVISDQEKAYKDFTGKISQIEKDLQSTSKPPFLSEQVHNSLNKVFNKVNAEVEESISTYSGYLKEDPIYDKVCGLFESKLTEPFNQEELEKIFIEGEERYKKKIPPGYEDEKNKEGVRKYGDLVLWRQVIKKAQESKKPIIFITDERKTDWWWKIKDGRTMGPRQELVEEMKQNAQVDFHMYSSERFLSYGQRFFEEQVNQKALEEIQEMKRAEIELLSERAKMSERSIRKELMRNEEFNLLRHKERQLYDRLTSLRAKQDDLRSDAIENPEVQEYIHMLSIEESELNSELRNISDELDSLKSRTRNKRLHKKSRQISLEEFIRRRELDDEN